MRLLKWFFGLFSANVSPVQYGNDADYADTESVWDYQVRSVRGDRVLADGHDCYESAYEASVGFQDCETYVVKVVDGVVVAF